MGIKGLWAALKPYTRDGHIRQFQQQRVAVDMYVWLHCSAHWAVTLNTRAYLRHLHRERHEGNNDRCDGDCDAISERENASEKKEEEISTTSKFNKVDEDAGEDDEEEWDKYDYEVDTPQAKRKRGFAEPANDKRGGEGQRTSPAGCGEPEEEGGTQDTHDTLEDQSEAVTAVLPRTQQHRQEEEEREPEDSQENNILSRSSDTTDVRKDFCSVQATGIDSTTTTTVKLEGMESASATRRRDPEDALTEEMAQRFLSVQSTFIDYVVRRIDTLLAHQVIPVCVFDGREMPLKAGTDQLRRQRRLDHFRTALRLLSPYEAVLLERWEAVQNPSAPSIPSNRNEVLHDEEGDEAMRHSAFPDAVDERDWEGWMQSMIPSSVWQEVLGHLEQSMDISTELAAAVMRVLQEDRHVECLVAPYEADAQLSYLCREGYVSACISEDSDLIAYFCPQIIAKLDKSGRCDIIQPEVACPLLYQTIRQKYLPKSEMSRVKQEFHGPPASPLLSQPPSPGPPTLPSTAAFTYELFLVACIMSGCDYLPNLRSVGVKRAFGLLTRCRSMSDLSTLLMSEMNLSYDAVTSYLQQVYKAFYAFSYHIVYCPVEKRVKHLRPLPPQLAQLERTRPATASDGSGGAPTKEQTTALSSSTTTLELTGGVVASTPHTTATTESGTSTLHDVIGELWPADIAERMCGLAQLDPHTLQPYRGVYQESCVDVYWQRTRAGQRRLTEFHGFKDHTHASVVMRPSATSRLPSHRTLPPSFVSTPGQSTTDERCSETNIAAPRPPSLLPSDHLTRTTNGSGAATTSFCGHHPLSRPQRAVPSVVLVRSKYFGHRRGVGGWAALCGQVFSSEEESDGDGGASDASAPDEDVRVDEVVKASAVEAAPRTAPVSFASFAWKPPRSTLPQAPPSPVRRSGKPQPNEEELVITGSVSLTSEEMDEETSPQPKGRNVTVEDVLDADSAEFHASFSPSSSSPRSAGLPPDTTGALDVVMVCEEEAEDDTPSPAPSHTRAVVSTSSRKNNEKTTASPAGSLWKRLRAANTTKEEAGAAGTLPSEPWTNHRLKRTADPVPVEEQQGRVHMNGSPALKQRRMDATPPVPNAVGGAHTLLRGNLPEETLVAEAPDRSSSSSQFPLRNEEFHEEVSPADVRPACQRQGLVVQTTPTNGTSTPSRCEESSHQHEEEEEVEEVFPDTAAREGPKGDTSFPASSASFGVSPVHPTEQRCVREEMARPPRTRDPNQMEASVAVDDATSPCHPTSSSREATTSCTASDPHRRSNSSSGSTSSPSVALLSSLPTSLVIPAGVTSASAAIDVLCGKLTYQRQPCPDVAELHSSARSSATPTSSFIRRPRRW